MQCGNKKEKHSRRYTDSYFCQSLDSKGEDRFTKMKESEECSTLRLIGLGLTVFGLALAYLKHQNNCEC